MRNLGLITLSALLAGDASAGAQSPTVMSTDTNVQPDVTVRFYAGPNLNLMHDWRQGIDVLAGLARDRGLTPERDCCISKSWGASALVHVSDSFALGASYDALRDTRKFSVIDTIDAFGLHESGRFGFENVTELTAAQAIVAVYPRIDSHMHVQFGAGAGRGRTELSTPGSRSTASLRGPILSASVGTETRFWYVDAGWRYARMRVGPRSADDSELFEARDVFPDVAAIEAFTRERGSDLSGVWAHIGIALHFGHR